MHLLTITCWCICLDIQTQQLKGRCIDNHVTIYINYIAITYVAYLIQFINAFVISLSAPIHKFSPFLAIRRWKLRIKGNTMAQWINVYRNSSYINLMWLHLLCEKTGAVALAHPNLMAGRLNAVTLRDFKIIYWMKHWNFAAFSKIQCHYNGTKTF